VVTDTGVFEARRLVRAAHSAALATNAGGQPFVALATPAVAPDFTVLLWLSSLSEHTRHLREEPRCALLFTGAPPDLERGAADPNPQTVPRVTLTGLAEPVADGEEPALKARWLARHPYARIYADFADFALWRIRPGGALLVGGFARAVRLRGSALAPDPAAMGRIAAAEADIIAHMNADHADAVSQIGMRLLGGPAGAGKLLSIDTDGCDLGVENYTSRLHFAQPASDQASVKSELISALKMARAATS
jgi:putative heme iron utilization protein